MKGAVVILVAPNGARRTKMDHPALPITIAETVSTARACRKAGADGLHLHVRDFKGEHSIDVGLYREALSELTQALPELPVQVTTEAAGIYTVDQQLAMLTELKPAWASVAVREVNRDRTLARKIYETCSANHTKVQHILYDVDDAELLVRWIGEGVIAPHPSVLLVLGRYSEDQVSDPKAIEPFVAALPERSEWMLCAFGPSEHECLIEAHRLGGDLRVGFENSVHQANGDLWNDMAHSVRSLKSALKA